MVLDIIGIGLVVLFFIRGYMKGLVVALFSLLAILLGVICSLKLSDKLAVFLREHGVNYSWIQIASYFILFLIVFLLVRLLAKAVESALKVSMLGWLNSAIGGLLYAFMIAVVWSSFLWLSDHLNLMKSETIAKSKTYPYFSKLAPLLFEKTGVYIPIVKHQIRDIQHTFNSDTTNVDTAR